MLSTQSRIAEFTRGFFQFLEGKGIMSVVLHGAGKGFEGDVSDVDFAVSDETFAALPQLIDAYCTECGWLLCQVLRHETTAAYFVCSAKNDPSRAVALDACSDYQRNGTLYLAAGELLANRIALDWGGYGLDFTTQLCYRFAKAAAKNKDVDSAALEFSEYSSDAQDACAEWLMAKWGIQCKGWSAGEIAAMLNALKAASNHRPSLTQAGAIGRIASRILSPTGMVVVTGKRDFEFQANRLEGVFGKFYFRKTTRADKLNFQMLTGLVASTLIHVPELSAFWRSVLPSQCVHQMDAQQTIQEQCQELALKLHERCVHGA